MSNEKIHFIYIVIKKKKCTTAAKYFLSCHRTCRWLTLKDYYY